MKFSLSDGNEIPALGFGTYLLKGTHGMQSIIQAINNGYRLIDCAGQYENEGTVGAAIQKSGVPRGQIFVTSKLPGRHHRYNEAIEQIEESLMRANLDYFDLYLIHWPNPLENHYVEAWQALIDAQKFGLIRSIGVSNFEPEHIDRIVKETGVTPVVNQVELHPYWSNKKMREYDEQHHIVTEAWSPLMRTKLGNIFHEPVITKLAEKYGKSPVQIVLRWELQLPVIPIPKAFAPAHQISNLDIFDFALTDDEVASLTALDRPDGRRADRDPNKHQEF